MDRDGAAVRTRSIVLHYHDVYFYGRCCVRSCSTAAMSSNGTKPYSVCIYGATSYTGRQVIDYLASHPQSKAFTFALAGRNKEKLEKLQSEDDNAKKHDILVVDLQKEDEVKDMVAKSTVILNLAGPFAVHNAENIVKECVAQGAHYVDLTGEAGWVGDLVFKYDYAASKTGACIVPSCGFDSIPSDLTVYLADRTVKEALGDSAGLRKSEGFFEVKGGISGGTVASMFAEAEAKEHGRPVGGTSEWRTVTGVKRESTPFQASYSNPLLPGVVGFFFLMYPYNRTVVRRSWYLHRSLHSSRFPATPYSISDDPKDHFEYRESLRFNGPRIGAIVISLTLAAMTSLFMSSKLFRWFAQKLLPASGQGPDPEKLRKGHFKVTNVSQSNTEPPVNVLTTMSGKGDPGYLSTAYMIAESALALALDHSRLPDHGQRGGVLTPATAFGDVLVERLEKSGEFEFESRVLDERRVY